MSIELTPCTSLHPPQILATGLSGLYSALPRRLSPWCESSPGWHRISADDLREMPELALFLSSLQFCDAVLQVSSAVGQNAMATRGVLAKMPAARVLHAA